MKQNNPDIHHRHSIRLKGYDYSQEGLYFITICTQNHKHLFGEIKNVPHVGTVGAGSACPESNINIPQMILNPYGEIIQQCYWDLYYKVTTKKRNAERYSDRIELQGFQSCFRLFVKPSQSPLKPNQDAATLLVRNHARNGDKRTRITKQGVKD